MSDLNTVAMIAGAKARGLTWAQIAPAIGCPDGRTAKAKAKRLARQAQAEAVLDWSPLSNPEVTIDE